MKLTRLSGLLAAALTVGLIAPALAGGQFGNLPIVGGAAYCALYAGDGTTCQGNVPAGPSALAGTEKIPADTGLASGASPQTVVVTPNTLEIYKRAASALTDGATITPDYNNSSLFTVTLGGNRTMAAISNIVQGANVRFVLTQDGTGSRTVTWNTAYQWAGGTAPTLTTTAAHYDVISCYAFTAAAYSCTSSLDVHH
jgi:hypothetical protein